jgi:NitT/TauT family transport system substrate-binding protein
MNIPRKPLFVVGLVATILLLSFLVLRSPSNAPLALAKVTLALPIQISSAPVIVALAQGLFQQQGVEVVSQAFQLGKDALNSVLAGKADLAVVADTPLMFALLKGEDIAMITGISRGRRTLAIVTRNDRGIKTLQDLNGKSVGLTFGTNMTYFFDAMMQTYGIPNDAIKQVDLKTADISRALKNGDIDAAVMFQPFLAELEAEMPDGIKTFYGEDVYAFRFILAGKPAYIDSHPKEVQQILKALIAANQSIHANPAKARAAVGKAVKLDATILQAIFDPEDFIISLDQAMLLALDDQARWAMRAGLVKPDPIPNFIKAIKYQHLEAVLPTAVTFVH